MYGRAALRNRLRLVCKAENRSLAVVACPEDGGRMRSAMRARSSAMRLEVGRTLRSDGAAGTGGSCASFWALDEVVG